MGKVNYSLCDNCAATQDECNFDRQPYPFCFSYDERRVVNEIRSDRGLRIRRPSTHESD